jgi:hypothetical protein
VVGWEVQYRLGCREWEIVGYVSIQTLVLAVSTVAGVAAILSFQCIDIQDATPFGLSSTTYYAMHPNEYFMKSNAWSRVDAPLYPGLLLPSLLVLLPPSPLLSQLLLTFVATTLLTILLTSTSSHRNYTKSPT